MPRGASESADAASRVGAILKAGRARALLTQEQLAERTGLSARSIRRWESGDASGRPYSSSLRLLAEALNLDEAEVAELGAAGRGHGDPTVREASSGPPITSSSMADLPRQLPAAPPAFTGRVAELADLDRAPDAATVVITAIDGIDRKSVV